MNKKQRERLERAASLISEAKEIIEQIRDEEQEKFENLSEGLQASEKGQALEENSSSLDGANDELSNVLETIEEVTSK